MKKTALRLVCYVFGSVVLLMGSGCDNDDLASLQAKNIPISVDSLCLYSSMGELNVVKQLVATGVDVNAKNSQGSNALIEAAWNGRKNVVSYLIDSKADVNASSASGLLPLSAALNQKQEDIAVKLLEHGANPNYIDQAGSTPLIEAAWQGNQKLVKLLIQKGADVNYIRPDNGFTALKAASDKPDIVQVLKTAGSTE